MKHRTTPVTRVLAAAAALVPVFVLGGITAGQADAAPARKSWVGAYIDWKAESGTSHRNLRYDCDADHGTNFLMAPQERNLCASTASPVTVYVWVPGPCHWDTLTIIGWRNSGLTAGKWHAYDRGLSQTIHRYGTC